MNKKTVGFVVLLVLLGGLFVFAGKGGKPNDEIQQIWNKIFELESDLNALRDDFIDFGKYAGGSIYALQMVENQPLHFFLLFR